MKTSVIACLILAAGLFVSLSGCSGSIGVCHKYGTIAYSGWCIPKSAESKQNISNWVYCENIMKNIPADLAAQNNFASVCNQDWNCEWTTDSSKVRSDANYVLNSYPSEFSEVSAYIVSHPEATNCELVTGGTTTTEATTDLPETTTSTEAEQSSDDTTATDSLQNEDAQGELETG